jgi:hypothetical protein
MHNLKIASAELSSPKHKCSIARNSTMSRSSDFDTLFDQLEAAIITARALQLKTVTDQLLLAVAEATHLMTKELHRPEARTQQ